MNPIKVLVVDDATFMRDIVRKALRSQFPSFQVEESSTGKQAQQRLLNSNYDLVLCDWEMPEMGGDELCQWMRGRPETEKTPFVMITSRGEKEHVVKAIGLGVNNYIVKPFTPDKLAGVVTKVLTQAKKMPESAQRGGLSAASKAFGNDSAAVLMGAQTKPRSQAKPRDTGRSGALPIAEVIDGTTSAAPAAKAPPRNTRPAQKVMAQLRFGDVTLSCLVREVDHERVSLVVRRADRIPQLLELAAFDFETGDEETGKTVSRLNGYVHTLQARDDSQESEFINVTVRLVDDDPQKQAELQKYIESIA